LLIYMFFFNIQKKQTSNLSNPGTQTAVYSWAVSNLDSQGQILNVTKTWISEWSDVMSDINNLLSQNSSWQNSSTGTLQTNTWISNLGQSMIDNEIIDLPSFNSDSQNKAPDLWDIAWNMPSLTWTTVFFGETESIKSLVLEPEYILKDSTWVFYIYLGRSWLNYEDMTKILGWDIYEINTKLDIQNNWLVWDWVKYINIPNITYTSKPTMKRKKVFMIISYRWDQWLVELDYDRYYGLKKRIKNIFEESYK